VFVCVSTSVTVPVSVFVSVSVPVPIPMSVSVSVPVPVPLPVSVRTRVCARGARTHAHACACACACMRACACAHAYACVPVLVVLRVVDWVCTQSRLLGHGDTSLSTVRSDGQSEATLLHMSMENSARAADNTHPVPMRAQGTALPVHTNVNVCIYMYTYRGMTNVYV